MKKKTKRQRAIIRRRIFIAILTVILAAVIAMLAVIINAVVKYTDNNGEFDSSSNTLVQSESNESKIDPNPVIAEATVVNTGDIILHSTVLDGAKTSDGNYDFSAFFTSAQSYFKSADLATANLEVTLGGTESGAFSGYPAFNAPDILLDTIKTI